MVEEEGVVVVVAVIVIVIMVITKFPVQKVSKSISTVPT